MKVFYPACNSFFCSYKQQELRCSADAVIKNIVEHACTAKLFVM